MAGDIESIVKGLSNADRRALATRSGQGDYSSACFARLTDKGLVDPANFQWTELGWKVIAVLHPHLTVRAALLSKE